MPINSHHPDYDTKIPQWERVRDCIDGADAIKAKKQTYLPALTGQSISEYNKYLARALYFSVPSRALSGLTGLMTRRPAILDYPESMESYFKDISGYGISFNELLLEMSNEVMSQSRFFAWIDFPANGGDPYILTAITERVINWEINNNQLLWVVIEEPSYKTSERDPYAREAITVYRRLALINGIFTVSVINKKGEIISESIPTVKGQPLGFIPGLFATPSGINAAPTKPNLLDICDISLAQYRNSADYENAVHVLGIPTPVVTGANSDGELRIGGTSAWVIPNDKARAFFLEFQGTGLQEIREAMNVKQGQAALFSSRLADTQARGSESAIAVSLRYSSEVATISTVANACESALNQLYKWVADFIDAEYAPKIGIPRQFINNKLSAADLNALTNAYTTGAIDADTYFFALREGEMVPLDKESFDSTPVPAGTSYQAGGGETNSMVMGNQKIDPNKLM